MIKIKKIHTIIMAIALFSAAATSLVPHNKTTSPPPAVPTSSDQTEAATKTVPRSPTYPSRNTSSSPSDAITIDTAPAGQEKRLVTKSSVVRETIVENVITDDNGKTYQVQTYQPAAVNDPSGEQWWTASATIDDSWAYPAATQTTLAIIDSGIALKHEEFTSRFYQNSGEVGPTTTENPSQYNCTDQNIPLDKSCNNIDDDKDGLVDEPSELGSTTQENVSFYNCTDQNIPLDKSCNLVDDDSNGLADDVTGWDFTNFDRSVQTGEVNPDGTGTTHGTLVTGVAAATGNNGLGIAGVDWHTKILPIQILSDDSFGDSVALARAIRYAIQQNADVITMSLGSYGADPYVRQAIREAIDADIVVVAASGNDGCECLLYPAAYPEVVAVGAADSQGEPASFSNWGDNLDILAPGVSLYTTNWTSTNDTSRYAFASGTSLATPVVGGLLSRARAQLPQANNTQIVAALLESTNKSNVGAFHSMTQGFGQLDANSTLLRATTPLTRSQIYAFSGVIWQNNTHALPYDCQQGSYRIFSKPDNSQFVLSGNNVSQSGYAAFAETCILLPHDNPAIVRNINVRTEFSQQNIKY